MKNDSHCIIASLTRFPITGWENVLLNLGVKGVSHEVMSPQHFDHGMA